MIKKRATEKFNFTRPALEAKPAPIGKQPIYYHDTVARGLCLCVTPKGKKTFFLYRKVEGRPERIRIGPFPDLKVEEARGQAAGMNSDIAKGSNPARRRRTLGENPTLEDLFNKYLVEHVEVHNRSPRNARWFFKACLSPLSEHKLHQIQRTDVAKLHRAIGHQRGPIAANRGIQLLRTLFNWASDQEAYTGPNPALGIVFFQERKRARFLLLDELPRFWKALLEEPNKDLRDLILLALFTGGRRGNVQAMRWEQIHWESATWTIPAGEAKAGEAMQLPLMPFAVKILKQRQADDGKSEWVFPSRGATGHLIEPKGAWGRLRKRAGLSDLWFHDLRRSLGSWMAATGSTLPVISKALGHRSLQATQIYARLDLDSVRKAMGTATDAILAGRVETKHARRKGLPALESR
jgi:integrase